jgi:hypothetical protein
MISSPCTHAVEAASGIPMHGSRLVLCRVCWTVIDPSPRLAPPRPKASRTSTFEKPAPTEPISSKPPSSRLPVIAAELEEEFRVPMPRRRLLTSVFLPGKKFLISLIVLPFSLYATWFYLMYYPSFQEHTDPTRQYAVLFPEQPIWSGGSSGGSDGEVTRSCLGVSETYRIQVSHVYKRQFGHIQNLNAVSLAQFMVYSHDYAVVRLKRDVLLANAAIDYEQWMSGKDVIVGRIIVVNDLVYEMTIRGSHLSLGDSRVQRFFNSFRFEPP